MAAKVTPRAPKKAHELYQDPLGWPASCTKAAQSVPNKAFQDASEKKARAPCHHDCRKQANITKLHYLLCLQHVTLATRSAIFHHVLGHKPPTKARGAAKVEDSGAESNNESRKSKFIICLSAQASYVDHTLGSTWRRRGAQREQKYRHSGQCDGCKHSK